MDNSQICILCRGSSMDKADKYFHKINGDMIAVNEFNVELKHDFVHRLFDNKNVTHLISKDTGLSNLKKEYYKKYGITNVILNRFACEANECSGMEKLIKSYGLSPSYLPNELNAKNTQVSRLLFLCGIGIGVIPIPVPAKKNLT